MDGSSEVGGLAVGWGQDFSVEVPIVMSRWTVTSALGVSGASGLEPEARDPYRWGLSHPCRRTMDDITDSEMKWRGKRSQHLGPLPMSNAPRA